MEQIQKLIEWCIQHPKDLAELWLAFVGLCSVIIKAFPVLSSQSWLLPFIKFIGKYGALNKTVTDDQRPS